MSLILDALNRARRDTEQVPGLAAQHYPDSDNSGQWGAGRWRARLPWLALLAALLVIAGLLLQRESVDRPAAPATTAGAVSVPGTEAAPAPQAAAPQGPVATPAPSPAVAAPVLPDAGSAATVAPPASAVRDAAVEALYRQPDPAIPPPGSAGPATASGNAKPAATAQRARAQPGEQAIDIESLVQQAQGELANAQLAEHPVLFLEALSQQAKDAIPTILYARHDYAGDPARSTVTLNGKVLRVGQSAASGLAVEEILADSVVLSYRGTRFRLRALNSWVNL